MKPIVYIASFLLAFFIAFLCVSIILLLMMGFISFAVWSLPVASPLTWGVFRILCIMSFVLSLIWSFSPENKEYVEETLEQLKKG